MLKKKVVNLILVIGMGLVLGLVPAMATAGGIITHGRMTSENGLEEEDNEQSDDDDGLSESQIQNQLYLFLSVIMNGHESFASAGDDTDNGSVLAASPDDDTEAGGCQQLPVSSLTSLLGFAWLMRLRRRR
jgi:hypothetical protein